MNDGLPNRRASDPSHVDDPDPVVMADAFTHLVHKWEEDYYATRAETESELMAKRRHLGDARRGLDEYLRRHFYTTAEVARLLRVSDRWVQAMAAQGSATRLSPLGEVIVLGLRSVRFGKLWFPKGDVNRLLSS